MNKQKKMYFIKQKLVGMLVIVLAILSVIFSEGDGTAALVMVPMGIGLIITKDMVLMNEYYWEVKEMESKNQK